MDDDKQSELTDDKKKQAHLALLDALQEDIPLNTVEDDDEHVEDEEEIPLSPVIDGPLTESSMLSAASNAPLLAEPDGSTSALRDGNPSKSQDTVSISSESQRKLRPESVLMPLTKDPLVLGIALVDFDHAVRPCLIPYN